MLEEELEEQIKIYSNMQYFVQQQLSKLPKGSLRISKTKNAIRFFYTPIEQSEEQYLPNQSQMPRQLAQRDYYEKALKVLNKLLYLMNNLKLALSKRELYQIFEKLHPQRKILITPLVLSDTEFIEKWQSKPYKNKGFDEHDKYFITNRGEKVRSKSEVIIADTFYLMKIPYRYEYPLQTRNGKLFFPDFTVLNPRTRKEYYFEHFGMMDNPDYASNFAYKIKMYSKEGIFPGENLIFTTETSEEPLDTGILKSIIRRYLS